MNKWLPGVINSRLGDLHYHNKYKDKLIKRHIDQIRSTAVGQQPKSNISRRRNYTAGSHHRINTPTEEHSSNAEDIAEATPTSTTTESSPRRNLEQEQVETEHIMLP